MPAKNTIREFEEGGIYHVYNRGLSKREIFLDNGDFNIFLYYLTTYILPLGQVLAKYPELPLRLQTKNLSQEIELLSYCLMPNHFHLLLKAKTKNGISKLMQQLTNAYTTYFNNKYGNEGPIMHGVYKCVAVTSDEQLIHVSRYIHLNPVTAYLVEDPKNYRWSSYNEYLRNSSDICNISTILGYFPSTKDWENFVLDQKEYSRSLAQIKHLTLEG